MQWCWLRQTDYGNIMLSDGLNFLYVVDKQLGDNDCHVRQLSPECSRRYLDSTLLSNVVVKNTISQHGNDGMTSRC